MKYFWLCILNVFILSSGQVLFKIGSKGKELNSIESVCKIIFSPIILCAIVLYGISTLLWIYILNKVDLSFAYPIQAIAFPIVLIASAFIFGENISINKIIGIIIIVTGVIIANIK